MKIKSTTYYWLAAILGGVGMGAAMGAEGTAQTTGYISGTLFSVSLVLILAAVLLARLGFAAEAAREAAERARMSAPVIVPPTAEEREMRAQAAAATQAAAFITPDGRLDVEAMQTMAAAQPSAPARKKYYFWVEFSPEDIKWFRQAAKERGFHFTRWRCCAEYHYHSSEPLLRCSGQAERSNAAGRRI